MAGMGYRERQCYADTQAIQQATIENDACDGTHTGQTGCCRTHPGRTWERPRQCLGRKVNIHAQLRSTTAQGCSPPTQRHRPPMQPETIQRHNRTFEDKMNEAAAQEPAQHHAFSGAKVLVSTCRVLHTRRSRVTSTVVRARQAFASSTPGRFGRLMGVTYQT